MSWNFLGAIAAFFGSGIASTVEQSKYNQAKAQIDAKHGKGSNLVLEYRLANKYYNELREQQEKARTVFTEVRHPEIKYYIGNREITSEEFENSIKNSDDERIRQNEILRNDERFDGEYIVVKRYVDGKPECLKINERVWKARNSRYILRDPRYIPWCGKFIRETEHPREIPVSELEDMPWTECVTPHPNHILYPCEIDKKYRNKVLNGECSLKEACSCSPLLYELSYSTFKLSRPIEEEAVARARIETRRRGYMPDNDYPYGDFRCFYTPKGVCDPYVEKRLMESDEIKNHGKIIDYDSEEV